MNEHQEPGFLLGEAERGIGERLRRAREQAGLSLVDVSQQLKMPVRVVESLEQEDWSRLGAPVFVRGQLRSYARLLGLATAPVHAASGVAPIQPTVLTPRTFTPPMQRMAEQASRRLVYIVLTAVFVMPIWMATRSHFDKQAVAATDAVQPATQPAAAASKPEPATMMASMTPMPAAQPASIALTVRESSWIRIEGTDGAVIEETMAQPGQQLRYPIADIGRIVVGNAAAADVQVAGRNQDLTPYIRANVARFTVSSDGALAPAER